MIILVGPSASGKTEIAKRLASEYGIVKAITHTSRPMRDGERNGVDYYFVTKKEFLAMLDRKELVESTFYNGNFYGCSKKEVADDKCIVVDVAGLDHFLELQMGHIVAFYLDVDEETRRIRMIGRGDKMEDIVKRIENDRVYFDENVKEKCDIVVPVKDRSINELAEFIVTQYRKILAKLD